MSRLRYFGGIFSWTIWNETNDHIFLAQGVLFTRQDQAQMF